MRFIIYKYEYHNSALGVVIYGVSTIVDSKTLTSWISIKL